MKKNLKLPYLPPSMEHGVATGSIAPGSGPDDVVEEWDEEDKEFHFEWDYQP